jgi:CubicO group peptidase (beta-lactamase class C family)
MNFIKEIKKIIEDAIKKNIFPSASIGVYSNQKNHFNERIVFSSLFYDKKIKDVNESHIYYDIASLTKPLATVLSILSLKKEGKIKTDDNLGVFF